MTRLLGRNYITTQEPGQEAHVRIHRGMKKLFLVICKLLFFAAAVGLDPDVDKALDALLHSESILKGLHRCMCLASQDSQAAGQNALLLRGAT